MKKKDVHPLSKWKYVKTPKTAKVAAGDKEAKDLTPLGNKVYTGVGGEQREVKTDY